jgi:predicted amidohydrolase
MKVSEIMKAAVAQVTLYNDLALNEKTISNYISLASKEDVDILCFPECCVTGYVRDFSTVDPSAIMETLDRIQGDAANDSVNVIVGAPYVEREKRFNSAIVLLTNGKRHIYHKINLTSAETAYFRSGENPGTFPLDDLTFGILICRDQNDALLAHEYKKLGVDALFILSAHFYAPREAVQKRDKNRALPIARAVENQLFVLKANAVGSASGKISLGDSLIVDPNGFVVQEADLLNETILSCELGEGAEKGEHQIVIRKRER